MTKNRGETPESPERPNVITGEEIRRSFNKVKTGDVLRITLIDGTTKRIAMASSTYDTKAKETMSLSGFVNFPSDQAVNYAKYVRGGPIPQPSGEMLRINTSDIKEVKIEEHLNYFDEI